MKNKAKLLPFKLFSGIFYNYDKNRNLDKYEFKMSNE